ncbi:MAG: hypothetical protein, partial [Olavius algarvensis Gamma 3 endosymbiont]
CHPRKAPALSGISQQSHAFTDTRATKTGHLRRRHPRKAPALPIRRTARISQPPIALNNAQATRTGRQAAKSSR